MKYKLINSVTKIETICEKVTIYGFDYYINDEKATEGFYGYINFQGGDIKKVGKYFADDWKLVIATNNPSIDIPKIVDEVEKLAHEYFAEERDNWGKNNPNGLQSPQSLIEHYNKTFTPLYKAGYNKSQETHSFSEEDVIEFAKFSIKNNFCKEENRYYQYWELLQLWKEQKPKIVYYEN